MSSLQAEIEAKLATSMPDVEVLLAELLGDTTVRLFIDHRDGVTLALCEQVTHALPEVRERYALEVSSPGSKRPLTKPDHFRRFLGRKAHVRLRDADDGHKTLTGELVGATARPTGAAGAQQKKTNCYVMPGYSSFSTAVLLLIYAFVGFEAAVVLSGETKEPGKTVPFGLIAALIIVAVFYIFIQTVSIGTLPGLATSERPIADAAAAFLGPLGAVLITIGALVSIIGNLNVGILSSTRMLFAMSEQRDLPRVFERTHVAVQNTARRNPIDISRDLTAYNIFVVSHGSRDRDDYAASCLRDDLPCPADLSPTNGYSARTVLCSNRRCRGRLYPSL